MTMPVGMVELQRSQPGQVVQEHAVTGSRSMMPVNSTDSSGTVSVITVSNHMVMFSGIIATSLPLMPRGDVLSLRER